MRDLIFIVGPTAVGKTDLAIALAKRLQGEIISADSVQVFRGLDIGSAKPTIEERQGIVHHLIDLVDAKDSYSVGQYAKDARDAIESVFSKGMQPIVTGGTGLYINALLYEMDLGKAASDLDFRHKMEAFAHREGNQALHEQLKAMDPEAADKIHPNNVKRVIRALEINHMTGKPMKDFKHHPQKTQAYRTLLIGLTRNRSLLYQRINKRVETMLEQGLLDEVNALKNIGLDDSFQSMQGIGYKEVLGYLNGHVAYSDMVEELKQNTRHYAKRQMTWFKRYEDMNWIDLDDICKQEEQLKTILSMI